MSRTQPIAPSERILNCIPSRDTEKDWTLANAMQAGLLAAAPLPPAVDLREDLWNVGDQGRTGSCVGWATVDGLLRWHFAKAGRMGLGERHSVRFIWMAAKEMDEYTSYPSTFIEGDGTSLKAALDMARKFGSVQESVLPFAQDVLYQDTPNSFYALASRGKIASYHSLGTDQAQWKTWLATMGPVLTRLSVDDAWMQASNTRGNLDTYLPATARGGHAVCLVGYTPDRFLVRNSWGETWGDKGFAYASPGYAGQAFTEAYGITL